MQLRDIDLRSEYYCRFCPNRGRQRATMCLVSAGKRDLICRDCAMEMAHSLAPIFPVRDPSLAGIADAVQNLANNLSPLNRLQGGIGGGTSTIIQGPQNT